MPATSLENLRTLIGAIEGHTSREYYAFSLLERGIPRGALTQIHGNGKTEIAVKFLSENPELKVAWIEQNFTLFPTGVGQQGVHLSRILCVDGGRDFLWASLQVIRSQLFQVVVVMGKIEDQRIIRNLQLAAEKSSLTVFLLSDNPIKAWGINLEIKSSKALKSRKSTLTLVRQR